MKWTWSEHIIFKHGILKNLVVLLTTFQMRKLRDAKQGHLSGESHMKAQDSMWQPPAMCTSI